MAYTYRSAFTYEYADPNVLTGGGLNPIQGASDALAKWAADGWEPYTIQYSHTGDYNITT